MALIQGIEQESTQGFNQSSESSPEATPTNIRLVREEVPDFLSQTTETIVESLERGETVMADFIDQLYLTEGDTELPRNGVIFYSWDIRTKPSNKISVYIPEEAAA